MNCGGYRVSEPFHIYTQDVLFSPQDSSSALVLIHNPEFGAAPGDWKKVTGYRNANRTEYLLRHWGLAPRNRVTTSIHAGWKGGFERKQYGSIYLETHWFRPEAGRLFLQLWHEYLPQALSVERKHPFAFVNLHENAGAPYTVAQFCKAHRAAVERIGLTASRAAGTHPHSHRHAFGQRLKKAKVPKEIIQHCMHHGSIHSQDVYTGPSSREMRDALEIASAQLTATPAFQS
jgi:hypothetical protein